MKSRNRMEWFRFFFNGGLWSITFAGLTMLVIDMVMFPEIDLGTEGFGTALFIAGGIGVYMMFATRKIATQLQDSIDNVSGKIDTMSGKIDTMSGKIDTMWGKIEDQTDVLKDIRDAVVNLASVQKPPK